VSTISVPDISNFKNGCDNLEQSKFFLSVRALINASRIGFLLVVLTLTLATSLSAQPKEIEVSTFYAKVYVAPSTNANFIGLLQKGERYSVITTRDNWYNIRFKNVNGWIEFSQAKIYDPNAPVAVPAESTATSTPSSASGGTPQDSQNLQNGSLPTLQAYRDAPLSSTIPPVASEGSQSSRRLSTSNPQSTYRSNSVTGESTQPVSEKKESKIRSWFTQQNVPELPATVNPNAERSDVVVYFKVSFPSGVRVFLDPGAPILGMSKRGDMLPLIGQGDSWCKVTFADSVGWIESKTGKIVDPTAPPPLDYIKILLAAGVVLILLLVIVIIVRARKKTSTIAEDTSVRKNVLIVSRSSKLIQYSLTNGTTSFERCFSEVGFDVTNVKEGAAIKASLLQNKTDIIMIDYEFDGSIIPFMEKVCSSIGITESVMTIVYNVPDPMLMQPGKVLTGMMFLGTSFSDRDLFKLITPMLRSTHNEQIQKSSHSSALAGNIGDGNLLEVLQFIEIGSKTGCLLVELEKPFAIICFKNGRINFAATADKIEGREAIFKVLELKQGKFRFVLDKKPKTSNINLSTLEILMEWTKTLDEADVR